MIYLPETESTNKYAMELVADGMAEHGELVWTKHQRAGRGQRGRHWDDEPGKSALMSVVFKNRLEQMDVFKLNCMVAYAVCTFVQSLLPRHEVHIKWPNDIYVDRCKVSGILIENVFRGQKWHAAVAGIGINLLQENFAQEYPACSIYSVSGKKIQPDVVVEELHQILLRFYEQVCAGQLSALQRYNEFLFRRNEQVAFIPETGGEMFYATVKAVDEWGRLVIERAGSIETLQHGTVRWVIT